MEYRQGKALLQTLLTWILTGRFFENHPLKHRKPEMGWSGPRLAFRRLPGPVFDPLLRGEWVRANLPKQQLVIEPNQADCQYSQLDTKVLKSVRTQCSSIATWLSISHWRIQVLNAGNTRNFLLSFFFFFQKNKCSQTRKRSNKVFSVWYLVWHSYWSTIMWLVCHSSWIHVRHHWVCIPKQQQRHDGRHGWIGNWWLLNYTPLIDYKFHQFMDKVVAASRTGLHLQSEKSQSASCKWSCHEGHTSSMLRTSLVCRKSSFS